MQHTTQDRPDSSTEEALKIVKRTKTELGRYRKQFESNWKKYENLYYGKHHKNGDDKKTVKNHVFKVIEGEVPILTDSMPGVQVIVKQEGKENAGKMLERAIEYVNEDQSLQLLLPTLVRESLIAAPGYLYSFWDADANDGEGAIRDRQLDWRNVFLDGNASKIEDSESCRIEIPMRRSALMRLYPEFRQQIKELSNETDFEQDNDELESETRDTGSEGKISGRPNDFKSSDILKYVETWVKDYTREDVPEEVTNREVDSENLEILSGNPVLINEKEDHAAHGRGHIELAILLANEIGVDPSLELEEINQTVQNAISELAKTGTEEAIALSIALSDKLMSLNLVLNHIEEHGEYSKISPNGGESKYKDNWRCIKSVANLIIYDGPSPEAKFSGPTLTVFYAYKDKTIYGFGEVKNIENAQHSLNDMDNKEYRALKVASNTGWVADHEAEVDENVLTNEEGIIIKKKRGTEVNRLQSPTVSPQLQIRQQADKFSIEEISGIREVSQGEMPAGGASGVAIAQLQTQAVGRIRLKDRYLQHYSMRRLGTIRAAMILNHWSDERVLRLRSRDDTIESFIFDPLAVEDLGYTVSISPGSMAGINRDALNAFFLNLLNSGHVTMTEFLSVADFPKREILKEKVEAREGMQAQMQMLNAELLKYKAAFTPQVLTPEEVQAIQTMQGEELKQQMLAQGQGQQINQSVLGQSMPEAAKQIQQ